MSKSLVVIFKFYAHAKSFKYSAICFQVPAATDDLSTTGSKASQAGRSQGSRAPTLRLSMQAGQCDSCGDGCVLMGNQADISGLPNR